MRKRYANTVFLSALLAMIIMVILARWDYDTPTPTFAETYGANTFWNFDLFEMLVGTLFLWPIIWVVIFMMINMSNSFKNSKGN
jgi:hypothetical protein